MAKLAGRMRGTGDIQAPLELLVIWTSTSTREERGERTERLGEERRSRKERRDVERRDEIQKKGERERDLDRREERVSVRAWLSHKPEDAGSSIVSEGGRKLERARNTYRY